MFAGVGGSQRVDGLEAPLTGRDAELRTVKDLSTRRWSGAPTAGARGLGPAGVGKSRLGWEFEKYVDGLADEVWWHRGRCLSYGDGVAFWALAEMVRQRLGIAEEDPPEVAASKLVEGPRSSPDRPTATTSRLGSAGCSACRSPTTRRGGPRDELFAGWRLFFERLAAIKPVVLLIDDSARRRRPAGLPGPPDRLGPRRADLLLVFTRPELDPRRPGWGTGRNR